MGFVEPMLPAKILFWYLASTGEGSYKELACVGAILLALNSGAIFSYYGEVLSAGGATAG